MQSTLGTERQPTELVRYTFLFFKVTEGNVHFLDQVCYKISTTLIEQAPLDRNLFTSLSL